MRRASRNCGVSFLFLFVLGLNGVATQAQYRFERWATEQGLPQNSVISIQQTRDGYLWLTTAGGLVRYDGVRFTVFDKNSMPGFASNRVSALFEDQDGVLWIGTEDAGVMRYAAGRFTTFSTQDGLPHNRVFKIQADNAGGVQISTLRGYCFWRNNRIVPDGEHLNDGTFQRHFMRSGAVWWLDKTGLRRLSNGRTQPFPGVIRADEWNIAVFYEDHEGALWIGATTESLCRIKGDVVTRYTEREGLPTRAYLRRFCQDPQGNLWITTQGSGLLRFQQGRFTAYTKADGLTDNELQGLTLDREGNLWIGTNTTGLNRLSRRFITGISTDEGLASNNVYPILQDRAGDIWIGATGSVSRYAAGKIITYSLREELGLPVHPQALYEDRSGRLWIGHYAGLGWLEKNRYQPSALVAKRSVYAMHEDANGALWIGTDNGLLQCQGEACQEFNTRNGLPGNDVKVLHQDRQGALWIGTYGGLARWVNGQFTSWTERDGLASNHVRHLHEDTDGTLWIGTYDGGLSRFKNGRFTNYNRHNGLANNGAFQILEDAQGTFWIGCNKGIYRVRKQQLNDFADGKLTSVICTAYGAEDGMRNVECNGGRQPAGVRTPDGKLWFPSQGGVVVIDPNTALPNLLPPPVKIESVVLDKRSVDVREEVRVAPEQKYLEIEYTALTFVKSEQAQFKYKLIGQDANWREAGTQRVAHYSYLPPGTYTFSVIAANSDGVWNTEGASLRIVVVPPFWRTWWFLTLLTGSLAGLVVLAVRQRLARLHAAHAAQEAFSRQLLASQERERQRIAAELHDSLGQSLLIIKNRAFLALHAMDDRAEATEQLDEISSSAAHAIEEVREIAYNLRPYQLDRFGLTRTLEAIFVKAGETSGIRFTATVASIDGLFAQDAEISIYRIVQESVNNILKHARATAAKLSIERNETEVRIRIEDNGQGFVSAARGTRNAESNASVPAPKAGGFGLLGMAERVRMLGGSYHIESAPGGGTTITIKLTIPTKPG